MLKLPDIDFAKIRTLGSSKNKGFEELAVQLFRAKFPENTCFYRVDDGGGDGGVEDIALVKNKKIGLQAKYFNKLGSSQWTQINKSVKTALVNHAPNLIEYHISTPVNRSKKSKSWDNYTKKWQEYALTLGYKKEVKFIWNGETELRKELIKEPHHSKVYYWFGCKYFSDDWLIQNFNASKSLLDTRYTPKLHTKTDSELKLDAFFISKTFSQTLLNKVKSLISIIQKDLINNKTVKFKKANLKKCLVEFRMLFANNNQLPSFSDLTNCLVKVQEQIKIPRQKYLDLREKAETGKKTKKKGYDSSPYSYELATLDKCYSEIYSFKSFINTYQVYDKKNAIVLGDAGSGKSHLLANSVEKAIMQQQSCLFVLGEQFLSSDLPLQQLVQIIGWEDGIDAFLAALDVSALISGLPSVITCHFSNSLALIVM